MTSCGDVLLSRGCATRLLVNKLPLLRAGETILTPWGTVRWGLPCPMPAPTGLLGVTCVPPTQAVPVGDKEHRGRALHQEKPVQAIWNGAWSAPVILGRTAISLAPTMVRPLLPLPPHAASPGQAPSAIPGQPQELPLSLLFLPGPPRRAQDSRGSAHAPRNSGFLPRPLPVSWLTDPEAFPPITEHKERAPSSWPVHQPPPRPGELSWDQEVAGRRREGVRSQFQRPPCREGPWISCKPANRISPASPFP